MSTALKCPNPGCSYLFDPTSVPTGVMLACPRCGMRFTLGLPGTAPPPDATVPNLNSATTQPGLPPPPQGYPAATAGHPANPPAYSAAPPAYPSDGSAPVPENKPVTSPAATRPAGQEIPQSSSRKSRFQTVVLAGVAAVAVTAVAIVIWYKVTHKDTDSADTLNRFKEVNLGFEPPPSPWMRDEDTRVTLGSPFILVYKRDNPEAYMAFGAKDFDPRSPRESELENGLKQALEKILDMPTLRTDPSQIESTWMGQEVTGFKFHAQLKSGAAVDGEACRFAHQGIGYWFLSWTGENNIFDEMQPSFAEARRHCKLLDFRKDWKERQSAVVPFKGDRTGYTILDAEGVWEEEKDESNLKFEGEGADKLLKLKRGKKHDEIQDSKLIVYVLSRPGNPMDVAREYVTGRRREEIKRAGDYPIEFVDITAPPEGDPIPGTTDKPVVRFKSLVKGAASQNRFHVISAANIDEKIVIVHIYTSLDKKDSLETLFIQIASSLHGG